MMTAIMTIAIMIIGKNSARNTEPTATTSSTKLAAILVTGSGLVFIAARVAALVP